MNNAPSDSKFNGGIKFLQPIALLVVLMATVIGGVVFVTARLTALETQFEFMNNQFKRVNLFMVAGERFTRAEGASLRNDLRALEEEVRKYPPQWFRNNFKDLRLEVKDVHSTIIELKAHLTRLEFDFKGAVYKESELP